MTVYAPTSARRPPLWLAAAAVASGWATVYSIASWIASNVVGGWVHFDVRMYYVAAEAGVRYGWSTIYDQTILRSLSTSFPDGQRLIDSQITFASPPLLAWLFVPLTLFPEPVAYALWTALSLAALVFAWYIAAPYTGLAKLTLLLVALGLTPVFGSLFLGQPIMIVIGLLAAAWWLCAREQPLAAGAALAFATFLKPQAVILVPAALLVSGRYRVVASWAAGVVACDQGSSESPLEHRLHARLFFGDQAAHLRVMGSAGSDRSVGCQAAQARARDCSCGRCDRNSRDSFLLSRMGLQHTGVGGVARSTHFATVVASTLASGWHSLDAAVGLHRRLRSHQRPLAGSATDLGCSLARDPPRLQFC